jgi:thymidine kinase
MKKKNEILNGTRMVQKMSLTLILGPMFSGKSSRLIELIRLYKTLDYNMLIIKPDIDSRYDSTSIATHTRDTESCITVPRSSLSDMKTHDALRSVRVIAIDEGQFFTGLYDFVRYCLDECRLHIYVAGLAGDASRSPFGEIISLVPICTKIEWLQALCIQCKDGTPGVYSKRIGITSTNESQIQVGNQDKYESVCHKHFM